MSNCWPTTAPTPAASASLITERIFVPNTRLADRPLEQVVEVGDRLHDLRAVGLVGEALVDLEERHDAA